MTRHTKFACVGLTLIFLFVQPLSAQQKKNYTDEDVGKAIDQAKAFLWSQRNPKFVYNANIAKDISPWFDRRPENSDVRYGIQYGGYSAMVIYALLAAGEKYDDPNDPDKRMKRVVEWLARQKTTDGTYSVGARMQVWAMLPPKATVNVDGKNVDRIALLRRDVEMLLANIGKPDGAPKNNPLGGKPDPAKYKSYYGMFDYRLDGKPLDGQCHSNTHFGFLGIWAAARCGVEIPKEFWSLMYEHYCASQESDGTWVYKSNMTKEPGGMTAAGLANLLVANDYLFADKFNLCGNNTDIPAVVKAISWLGSNFNTQRHTFYYYHYCLERVGLGAGYKFIGDKDWYKLGVQNLLEQQNSDGSFKSVRVEDVSEQYDGIQYETVDGKKVQHLEVPTAFALLFLVRGRSPVIMNKLWYTGDWNNRPGAMASLAKFASDKLEAEINWQIVTIKTPTETWHDSPALLIAGQNAPTFSDEEIAKLRTFILQGGTIVSVAECGGQQFSKGMREAYTKMFPKLELAVLPQTHPLFEVSFKIQNSPHKVFELTNGLRPLAFHFESDLLADWQARAFVTQKLSFEEAINAIYLISGGKTLRNRGVSPWPEKPATMPASKVAVVRIKHSDPYSDPEPLAWERLKLIMANEGKVSIETPRPEPVELSELETIQPQIALITGKKKLELNDEQKNALKKFVEKGGIVIIDAAGGSDKFYESARTTLENIFGAGSISTCSLRSSPFDKLPSDFKPKYRRGTGKTSGALDLVAVSNKGKPAVFLFQDDITCGLLGLQTIGLPGLNPDSAVAIARCIVLHAAESAQPTSAPTTSTSQPTSQP